MVVVKKGKKWSKHHRRRVEAVRNQFDILGRLEYMVAVNKAILLVLQKRKARMMTKALEINFPMITRYRNAIDNYYEMIQ